MNEVDLARLTKRATSDVFQFARDRYWLTPTTQAKMSSLLQHGLTLEQALVGTGLLTMDEYVEALLSLDERVQDVMANEKLHASTAATLPTPPHHLFSRLRAWFLRANKLRASTIQFATSTQQPRILFLNGSRTLDQESLSASELGALRLLCDRFAHAYGWDWKPSRLGGFLHHQEIDHTSHDHPITLIQVWKTFMSRPQGLLHLHDIDAWTHHQIAKRFTPIDTLDTIRDLRDGKTGWIDHTNARTAALIEACAFSGIPLVFLTHEADDVAPLLERLNAADIPVSTIRTRTTISGTSWEA